MALLVVCDNGDTISMGGTRMYDGWSGFDGIIPDLTDPCTLGGLLHLVRDAWGDSSVSLCCFWWYKSPRWRVGSQCGPDYVEIVDGSWGSEIEALVAALEAAP